MTQVGAEYATPKLMKKRAHHEEILSSISRVCGDKRIDPR